MPTQTTIDFQIIIMLRLLISKSTLQGISLWNDLFEIPLTELLTILTCSGYMVIGLSMEILKSMQNMHFVYVVKYFKLFPLINKF